MLLLKAVCLLKNLLDLCGSGPLFCNQFLCGPQGALCSSCPSFVSAWGAERCLPLQRAFSIDSASGHQSLGLGTDHASISVACPLILGIFFSQIFTAMNPLYSVSSSFRSLEQTKAEASFQSFLYPSSSDRLCSKDCPVLCYAPHYTGACVISCFLLLRVVNPCCPSELSASLS